jgi:hypothetical protein
MGRDRVEVVSKGKVNGNKKAHLQLILKMFNLNLYHRVIPNRKQYKVCH